MDTAYPLRVAASKFPSRAALIYRERELTFEELDAWVDRLARGLCDAGLGGKVIASVLHNDPRTVCLYLAIARAGAVCVPVNTRLTAAEIEYIIKDAGADVLVVDREILSGVSGLEGMLSHLERIVVLESDYTEETENFGGLLAQDQGGEVPVPVDETGPATIIYTSGTSGFPKGVVKSHKANVWAVVNSLIGSPRSAAGDRELFALPMFGIGFVYQVIPTLFSGGTVILDRVFDPSRCWEIIEKHSVTRAFFAPTMIAALLDVEGQEKRDASSLGTVLVAYEFSDRLRARALERFGDVFVNMYGLTEAQLCATSPGEFAVDPSSAGRPMGLARVRIVDANLRPLPVGEVGEIGFETPSAMSEYKGLDEESRRVVRGSCVLTGDLGYLDEHGNLHFAGRSKEIIKSGGFSIDPVEIENVIQELESVSEAAVVGLKDERWGERVVAFVVADEANSDPVAIQAHCRGRLASFKVPKDVRFLEALPRNATGKVMRGRLREVPQ